jgi:hypothetical protein
MIQRSYALGHHGFFYLDGSVITIPAAGTGSVAGASSRTNKPDPTDPLYVDVGAIADWSDDIKSMGDEKVYKPAPGRMMHYDTIEKGAEYTKKFTTQELLPLAVQAMYRTQQNLAAAGGAFNPLSAPPLRGWFHTELYDQSNLFIMNLDLYGVLRVTGGWSSKEGGLVKPQWELNVLFSTLNVGLLTNSNV